MKLTQSIPKLSTLADSLPGLELQKKTAKLTKFRNSILFIYISNYLQFALARRNAFESTFFFFNSPSPRFSPQQETWGGALYAHIDIDELSWCFSVASASKSLARSRGRVALWHVRQSQIFAG